MLIATDTKGIRVWKFNPFHDKGGRFASGGGSEGTVSISDVKRVDVGREIPDDIARFPGQSRYHIVRFKDEHVEIVDATNRDEARQRAVEIYNRSREQK